MKDSENLRTLVQSLQDLIKEDKLSGEAVKKKTDRLAKLGNPYRANLFPELQANANFRSVVGAAPNSLAEALLWKMGKWNAYKEFVNNYDNTGSLTKKTDVVFSAFARHLKDSANPIYDQHVLRAMWAINTNFETQEKEKCKVTLIKSKGKDKGNWKPTLSGGETIECYNLYVKHLNKLTKSDLSNSVLDRLLMPLGQALKTTANSYKEFQSVCGWDSNG